MLLTTNYVVVTTKYYKQLQGQRVKQQSWDFLTHLVDLVVGTDRVRNNLSADTNKVTETILKRKASKVYIEKTLEAVEKIKVL